MPPMMDDPMSEEEEDEDEQEHPSGISECDVKPVVLEGEEIVEEEIYAYGDPDDPLDRVLDVYLAEDLEDNLYLLQYPMRPADRPLSVPHAAKVKVANHLLEVEHAIKQGGRHFDSNAPPQLRQPTQRHAGSRVRPATNFSFGVVRNNQLHLTPVHATMQMRPCFDHIDEAKALEVEMDLDDVDAGARPPEKPQQVSFKKKETERATAARKSTYAYKKSIEDAEAWVPLQVHGQNDQISLDEFSRMFVEHEQAPAQGTTAKEFPAPERYLQGLDYMEEYDENGESFSVGGRGRSHGDSIDLVTPGTSTYSPVNIPEAPLQQLGGDAKVVAYLKLAHLVPFSVLLDVTKMSASAVLGALSADGRRRGLLIRGNWAALAADVWPQSPPHADDCLDVSQYMMHKYGAISRPDLQRRFPSLDPMVMKTVLSNIAELDTVGRRWVPKLRDGIAFGIEYRHVIDLEEDRWAIQATSLRDRLGDDILAPPACQAFEPFVEIVNRAVDGGTAMQDPELFSNDFGSADDRMGRHRMSGDSLRDRSSFDSKAMMVEPREDVAAEPPPARMPEDHVKREIKREVKGELEGPMLAPKRKFKPKKPSTKPVAEGGAAVALDHGTMGAADVSGKEDGGQQAQVEGEDAKDPQTTRLGVGAPDAVASGSLSSVERGGDRLSLADGSRKAEEGGVTLKNEGGPGRPEQVLHVDAEANGTQASTSNGSGSSEAMGADRSKGKGKASARLPAAKEEPREQESARVLGGAHHEMELESGERSESPRGDVVQAKQASVDDRSERSRAKKEPAPRPKVRPRANRAKPKPKGT